MTIFKKSDWVQLNRTKATGTVRCDQKGNNRIEIFWNHDWSITSEDASDLTALTKEGTGI